MSRVTQILLPVVVLAAALAAYWYLALAPKRAEVAKLDSEITTKQAAVAQAEATANDHEASRRAYRRNYTTVVRLGKAVPADEDVRSLVVQLDTSAKRSKIDFDSIALTNVGGSAPAASGSQAATPGGFVTVPFTFSFQGSFFRLSDFFSQLDRFVQVNGEDVDATGRLLHIDTFSLKPGADSQVLSADVTATSDQLPSSEGLTAGATAQGPNAASTAAAGAAAATTPPSTATNGVPG